MNQRESHKISLLFLSEECLGSIIVLLLIHCQRYYTHHQVAIWASILSNLRTLWVCTCRLSWILSRLPPKTGLGTIPGSYCRPKTYPAWPWPFKGYPQESPWKGHSNPAGVPPVTYLSEERAKEECWHDWPAVNQRPREEENVTRTIVARKINWTGDLKGEKGATLVTLYDPTQGFIT